MAELTPMDRLQPSLLDRLIDEQPEKRQESREQRVLSLRKLRAAVIRDLSWLLNTGPLSAVRELDEYPLVAASVLNYGCADLAGSTASGVDLASVEKAVREAILRFEPRLIPGSVRVTAAPGEGHMSHRALTLEIEAQLWAQPLPEQLFLRTEMDLETGEVAVEEQGRA